MATRGSPAGRVLPRLPASSQRHRQGCTGPSPCPTLAPPPQKKAAAEAAPGVPPPGEDKHTGRRVGALRRQTPRAARPLRRGTGGTPGSPAPPSHPPQTRRKKILRRRKRRRKILRRRKDTLQAEGRLRARRFLHGRCLPRRRAVPLPGAASREKRGPHLSHGQRPPWGGSVAGTGTQRRFNLISFNLALLTPHFVACGVLSLSRGEASPRILLAGERPRRGP